MGAARAQPAAADSLHTPPSDSQMAYDTALSLYHAYLNPETGLFRGDEYATYDFRLREGNPYWSDKRRHGGSVVYDSVLYNNVQLMYDEVKDLLILYDFTNLYKVALFPVMVSRFTMDNHRWIRLTDSLNPNQPRNGFYEILYQGRIMLLKKEKKVIEEDLSGTVAQYFIQGADSSYYLKKNNVYYSLKTTKSLLRALKDRSKDVKRFIRSNGLSMRRDRENTLLKVSAWYDTSSAQ